MVYELCNNGTVSDWPQTVFAFLLVIGWYIGLQLTVQFNYLFLD